DASPSKDENEGKGFIPIGTEEMPFTGGYDGDDFTIDGLTINRVEQDYVGLFGFITAGEVKNTVLDGALISGKGYVGSISGFLLDHAEVINSSVNAEIYGVDLVGGIAGHLVLSSVQNSRAYVTINSTGQNSGGIVGQAANSTISNCVSDIEISSTSTIVGGIVGLASYTNISQSGSKGRIKVLNDSGDSSNAGGVAGLLESSSISQSYFKGSIEAKSHAGGIAGTIQSNSSIDNSYALGVVEAEAFAGGLVGQSYSHESIINSYASVFVAADSQTGGLIGLNQGESPINDSFWNTETSKLTVSDGGTEQSTEQMQTKVTYSNAGWDFDSIWRVNGKQYPELQWQKEPIFVASYDDLKKIGNDPEWPLDGHYIQTANIDASASARENKIDGEDDAYYGFKPIGSSERFTGSYDGAGFSINSLLINNGSFQGLFGFAKNAYISNVTLNDVTVGSDLNPTYVAGLVGYDEGSFIDNCTVSLFTANGGEFVGGLIGYSLKSIVINSSVDVSIESIRAGGLIAYALKGMIVNSGTEGIINSRIYYAGGLIGSTVLTSMYYCKADVEISSYELSESGGLVANASLSNIISSSASGDVVFSAVAGGLIGVDGNNIIERSFATGDVAGDCAGGLVALKSNGSIHKSYASGNVTAIGEDCEAGGLVGSLGSATVTNSYALGNVSGETGIAGLIGKMTGNASVYNSYSAGTVTSSSEAGGLVAIIEDDATVNNSFWDIQTSGQEISAGSEIGLTTAEMQTQSTFIDAGWDFENIWVMNGYPKFKKDI
ncbi:MAG: hypothetical protein D6B28_05240, partial [Gammaproteobacteria bacterium]